MIIPILVILVILLALFFTYTNGFQDGSSVTACALASRAMSPHQAVILVAICELAGALFGGSAVCGTIQAITNWPAQPSLLPVLISGLVAAIAWNYITRYLKVPSSSTHALVGGVLGALYAAGGLKYIVWGRADLIHPTGVMKVVITLFVSPLVGFVAGFLVLLFGVVALSRATMRIAPGVRWLQWVATAVLGFAHGANDPQKSMGIIMLCLYAVGHSFPEGIPIYVRLASGLSIALGVASLAPGIVKRVGSGIFKMRSLSALSAEAASAAVVLFGSLTGGPVAASQVISSSVMGVGSAVHVKNVHWMVAKDMLLAWFLTIPCSAVLSYGLHGLVLHWLEKLL
ncbi:MAG TPA: inorganic phosphate transporter [Candidatus Obscuribacterales bacterium]